MGSVAVEVARAAERGVAQVGDVEAAWVETTVAVRLAAEATARVATGGVGKEAVDAVVVLMAGATKAEPRRVDSLVAMAATVEPAGSMVGAAAAVTAAAGGGAGSVPRVCRTGAGRGALPHPAAPRSPHSASPQWAPRTQGQCQECTRSASPVRRCGMQGEPAT